MMYLELNCRFTEEIESSETQIIRFSNYRKFARFSKNAFFRRALTRTAIARGIQEGTALQCDIWRRYARHSGLEGAQPLADFLALLEELCSNNAQIAASCAIV